MTFDKILGFFSKIPKYASAQFKSLLIRAKIFFREDEHTLRRDALISTVMFSLLLPWMLLLKFNKVYLMRRGYLGFVSLSLKQRFLLDLVPFRFTEDYVNQIIVILLNCIIFAPFGVVFNTLFKKKSIRRDLLICFLISFAIEIIQLFTMLGGFATIDLITNTLSYFIGLLVFRLVFARISVNWNVRIYRIANVIMLPLVIIAIVTTVGNFDVIWGILTRTLK